MRAPHRLGRVPVIEIFRSLKQNICSPGRTLSLPEDAYIASFIPPQMQYDKVWRMTVSYCGLVHPPVRCQYFYSHIYFFTLACETPNLSFVARVCHLRYGRSRVALDPSNVGPAIGTLMAELDQNTSESEQNHASPR